MTAEGLGLALLHRQSCGEREFDLDEAVVKPYLQLDNMIEAAFDVAGRLFGLSLTELGDVAGPHPERQGVRGAE